MRPAAVVLAATLAVAPAGCTDPSAPAVQGIAGAWLASLPSSGSLSLALVVSGTTVTGTGAVASLANPQPLTLTVTGQWNDPQVILTLSGFGGGPATFAGERTGPQTLTGTLDGGGFTNQPLTFTR